MKYFGLGRLGLWGFVVLLLGAFAIARAPEGGYHLLRKYELGAAPGGKEYWDYITRRRSLLLRLSFYAHHSPSTWHQSLTKYSLCKLFVLIFIHPRGYFPHRILGPALCLSNASATAAVERSWHHIIDQYLGLFDGCFL